MHGRPGYLAAGLLALATVQVVAVVAIRHVFVYTGRGQLLDATSLAGNTIGEDHVEGLVSTVLNAMSVLSLAAATLAVVFISLLRGRVVLAAVAGLLIAGANLTTQLLKYLTDRPDLGVDAARVAAGNSLPSGHTTLAASVAVALVLVVPPRMRGLVAVLGAGYAALAGVGTLSAGWHRPSDAVAALLIVGAWAAVAGLVLGRVAAAAAPDPSGSVRPHGFAVAVLGLAGGALLAVALLAVAVTDAGAVNPPENLGWGRLFIAYAGGAAGIAGVAGLVMASVLAPVHLVVPRHR